MKAFMEASVEVTSGKASVKVASVEPFVDAFVQVASVEASVEVFMEASVELDSVESSVDVASAETFMEAPVEVDSMEASVEVDFVEIAFLGFLGSFRGSSRERCGGCFGGSFRGYCFEEGASVKAFMEASAELLPWKLPWNRS